MFYCGVRFVGTGAQFIMKLLKRLLVSSTQLLDGLEALINHPAPDCTPKMLEDLKEVSYIRQELNKWRPLTCVAV